MRATKRLNSAPAGRAVVGEVEPSPAGKAGVAADPPRPAGRAGSAIAKDAVNAAMTKQDAFLGTTFFKAIRMI